MYSIVLANNLVNDFCHPAPRFEHHRINIGKSEIDRLFCDEGTFGNGVLPTFIKEVIKARQSGKPIGIIFVQDQHDPDDPAQQAEISRYGEHCLIGTEGAEILPGLSKLADQAEIINTGSLAMPLPVFRRAVKKLSGLDPLVEDPMILEQIRFLLVGVHTEKRVLGTANLLRNVLGFRHVAVSPYLVGSSNREGHFIALRYSFADALIQIIPNLTEAAEYVGFDPEPLQKFGGRACRITPEEIRGRLNPDQQIIIQTLCMHWDRADLKSLKGGFSGSQLLLAHGYKGSARTEPMVIKIDDHQTIRRELEGFERVNDLLGKNVPTLSSPVTHGHFTGISMDLASMEGSPLTLQDRFEAAMDDNRLEMFLNLFRRTLSLLVQKVYQNTQSPRYFAPYRHYLLHIDRQEAWLAENITNIQRHQPGIRTIIPEMLHGLFQMIRKNDDGLISEMCLSHGDLNLANVICDERENVWIIDWTDAGLHPLEIDFCKIENDIKFVVSKDFEAEDFDKLQRLENYFLNNPRLIELEKLPKTLRFAKWDIRFKKVYLAVKIIRDTYFSVKQNDNWFIYQIALLRYALHTLSFDQSLDRGECGPAQLWYTLYSIDQILEYLVADDFHLKIRGERPESYPLRQRILIDQARWQIECPEYDPPVYTSARVLENDHSRLIDGWADPKDIWHAVEETGDPENFKRDTSGKPLHPHGRTGIAGRGDLAYWGPNPLLVLIITHLNPTFNELEILTEPAELEQIQLIERFIHYQEPKAAVLPQVITDELKLRVDPAKGQLMHQGVLYDPRQTDNAWVVAEVFHFHLESNQKMSDDDNAGYRWKVLSPKLINHMASSRAKLLRLAIQNLVESRLISAEIVSNVLKKSG